MKSSLKSTTLPDQSDVERLLKDPSAHTRRTLAEKLGKGYAQNRFSDAERKIADDIVRAVARDVELEVRLRLAETICLSGHLPPDVAKELANDVAEVAEPILSKSDVLADEALVEIIHQRSERHRAAIASRVRVSEPVSGELAVRGDGDTLKKLAENEGAEIDDNAFDLIIDKAGTIDELAVKIASRSYLPLRTAERLVGLVSETLRQRTGQTIDGAAREGATLLLGGGDAEGLDVMRLLDRLKTSKRLNPSLVTRAAMAGDWELALQTLCRLTGRNRADVRQAMRESQTAMALLSQARLGREEAKKIVSAYLPRTEARH